MAEFQGITLLGLGPGNPDQLTLQAWKWLSGISEVYVRTRQHPTIDAFPQTLKVSSFDYLYEQGESFEWVYDQIISEVLNLGKRPEGVTYAVPGHPFVAETTGPEIARRARLEGIPVQVIDGMSFLDPVFSALGEDPFPTLILADALQIGMLHTPPFPPDQPVLIAQIYSRETASDLKLTLTNVYPDEHRIRLIHAAGTAQERVEDLALYEIDRSAHTGLLTCLYLPPLEEDTSLESFQEVVAHLRAPDGCPWDKEQTHLSLRKYLLEETYEAIAALDAEDPESLAEELGDLLLQIVLHAQIASEDGEFQLKDIIHGVNAKIIHRHPHVFGSVEVDGVKGVLQNWEKLKATERAQKGEKPKGMLDSVPTALPALSLAQEYLSRAGRVGFELTNVPQLTIPEGEGALGEWLMGVAEILRQRKVDGESVLRMTNQQFRRRFAWMERTAAERGEKLGEYSSTQIQSLWQESVGH